MSCSNICAVSRVFNDRMITEVYLRTLNSVFSELYCSCSCSYLSETPSLLHTQRELILTKSDQWDYKPLPGRSFKPHLCPQGPRYITPFTKCHISASSSLLLQGSQDKEHPDKTEVLTWRGRKNVSHGRGRSNGSLNGSSFIRQRCPRWKPSVMIDGHRSTLVLFESALPWLANCRRPQSIALIGLPVKGKSRDMWTV